MSPEAPEDAGERRGVGDVGHLGVAVLVDVGVRSEDRVRHRDRDRRGGGGAGLGGDGRGDGQGEEADPRAQRRQDGRSGQDHEDARAADHPQRSVGDGAGRDQLVGANLIGSSLVGAGLDRLVDAELVGAGPSTGLGLDPRGPAGARGGIGATGRPGALGARRLGACGVRRLRACGGHGRDRVDVPRIGAPERLGSREWGPGPREGIRRELRLGPGGRRLGSRKRGFTRGGRLGPARCRWFGPAWGGRLGPGRLGFGSLGLARSR